MSDAERLLKAATSSLRDPASNQSIWKAGLIREPRIDGEVLRFQLHLGKDHSRGDRSRLVDAVADAVKGEGWTGRIEPEVFVEGVRRGASASKLNAQSAAQTASGKQQDPVPGMSGPGMQPHGGPIEMSPIPGVTHIVAVASGKGGVGKSTVATNLACALADLGHKVGLMDADIYGPSLPLMMNVKGAPVADGKGRILPLYAYGVKCMSIGFLVDETQPIIWRGPMVMGVVRQFLQDVNWAPVDYLIIDLPPGTGDTQLTMVQNVPVSGSVIVTTPQEVALLDARRGVEMFRKLKVPVLGVIENMSWYTLPDGSKAYPFGQGGGAKLANELQAPLLGQIPLDPDLREGGDSGNPAVLDRDSDARPLFRDLAHAVALALPPR